MIVERDQREWFTNAPQPERRKMVKIARAEKRELRDLAANEILEHRNVRRARTVPEARTPVTAIDARPCRGCRRRPGAIEIEVRAVRKRRHWPVGKCAG